MIDAYDPEPCNAFQLATCIAALTMSRRRCGTSANWPLHASNAIATKHSRLAGNNRFARRTTKADHDTRPVRWCSRMSNDVMRKPDNVKNTDTPT